MAATTRIALARSIAVLLLIQTALIALTAASASASSQQPDDHLADLPTSQLLAKADGLLSSGKGGDALELYNVLVERDSSSYLNLFKRGTARLALGQTKKALDDFQGVLALTEFDQARLQSARIQLRLGQYSESLESLGVYLETHASDRTALELKGSVQTAEAALARAEKASSKQDWEGCVNGAGDALELSSASTRLLELRAGCYSKLDRIEDAAGDLTRAVSLSPNNPEILTRLSLLSALFLPRASSNAFLAPMKQCLHFDPDSRSCKKLFRSLKSLDKDMAKTRNFVESGGWRSALNLLDPKGSESSSGLVTRARALVAEHADAYALPAEARSQLLVVLYGWTCKAYVSNGSVRLAAPACREVHARDPENTDGLLGLGELALKDENHEEAVRHLSAAFEKGGRSDRQVLDKLQKAQRLLKQSKKRDYYKVLGVDRDADTKTIKKAYRRMTKIAHPDKETGSEEKMAAVNQAWEVLGNPELRRQYDNGQDPNDPETQQQQHHQHPFQQGAGGGFAGNPFFQQGGGQQHFFHQGGFGGGGGNFKFHFG